MDKHELLAEIKHEAAATRKVLERVPMDKADWVPHEKSMKMGRLANHVCDLFSWISAPLTSDELDFGIPRPPLYVGTTEELLEKFDRFVAAAIADVDAHIEAEQNRMWTLRNGEHVIFTMPKATVIRTMALNHLVHHRGQLTVYLRLNDVAVPGLYGPSADER